MADMGWRRLGRTEMKVRSLGLGCAFFGGNQSSDEDTFEGVRRGIDLGLNFVDTSPLYGESERRVGLALEDGYRERVYLQTKTGTHPDRRQDFSAAGTRWSVENSLKLLKTDRFDSVLIHDPRDIEAPFAAGACLDELLKMKEEGILDHIGIGVREHDFHRRDRDTSHRYRADVPRLQPSDSICCRYDPASREEARFGDHSREPSGDGRPGRSRA